ncbi:MAG: plastocyanin/azurin family copper-binding protein [Comamonas sp.]
MSAFTSVRLAALLLGSCAATLATAETFEVKMLNRGPHAAMAYEPELINAAPGDSVKFVVGSSGHDAASMPEIMPSGGGAFAGKTNQEFTVTLSGVKCLPHYAMGMVMLIRVGDVPLSTLKVPESVPEQARQRFQSIVSRASQSLSK